MTRHQEKVDAVVHRAIQRILAKGVADPRVRGLVSVTRVSVSPDSSEARIWCSVLPEERASSSIHGLNAAAGWISRRLGGEVRMRRIPRLRFLVDESIKKEAEVLGAINDAMLNENSQTEDDQEDQAT